MLRTLSKKWGNALCAVGINRYCNDIVLRTDIRVRLLHTMIRVGNLKESLDFYTRVLGMTLLRKKDYPSGKFTLAFVGYGDEADTAVIELTHNWEVSEYDMGDGVGHIALGVDDIYAACQLIKEAGAEVIREPGPMKHGGSIIAFVQDPDGYKICLLYTSPSPRD